MNGGRFDFDDGGTFCGGWEEGKAHGHGVCTGPDSQGEYAGAWHYGFEVSGIYIWPSGSTYSGQWQNGKRHGLGLEQRGRWIYKGEWAQGYKGRYGRREAINSNAHYLGTWSTGLHDGYGTEVYADGGSYKGQWLRGLRHGYGIRTSATFESASKHRSRSNTHASLTSLRSNYEEDADGDAVGNRSARDKKSNERHEMRGGFVLKLRSLAPTRRRRSLSERSLAVKRTLLSNLRIKKQHSTGDIHQRVTSTAGSLRSSGSTISCTSDESDHRNMNDYDDSQEEKVDPSTIEVYKGEWKNDVRSGFGICERSDGLRYVGEWLENKKHGYGITFFKDGTKEEGRYKGNILVCSIRRRGIFFVRTSKLRERVESSIENARRSAEIAAQRVEIALSRTMTAQERSDASIEAAERAKDDADTARIYCAQFDPSFRQPGIDHIRQSRGGNRNILQNSSFANHVSFESTTSAIHSSGFAHNQQSHLFLQKHHGMPPPLPPHQQQQPYQFYNQNHKTLNKLSNDSHQLHQHQYQLSNPRIAEPQHQLDSNNVANDSRYNTVQKNSNILLNPETISTSGLSIHHNELNNQNSNQQQLTSTITKQNNSLSNPQTNLQQNIIVDDNIIYSNNINGNGLLRNQFQNQSLSLQSNLPMDTLSGASTSKINSIGQYNRIDDTMQQNRMLNRATRNRTDCMSTMSLSDDHFDQYTMKKAAPTNENKTTIFEESIEPRLRRNRPSLTRQLEVTETLNINRRSTLASSRDQKDVKIESYFLHNNCINDCQAIGNNRTRTESVERGSLPNLTELDGQEIYLKREEASRLASERRRETQRIIEEEERLHSNPLRYIYHPVVKNWFKKWRVSILLLVGNIFLLYYLMYLLTLEKKAKSEAMGRKDSTS